MPVDISDVNDVNVELLKFRFKFLTRNTNTNRSKRLRPNTIADTNIDNIDDIDDINDLNDVNHSVTDFVNDFVNDINDLNDVNHFLSDFVNDINHLNDVNHFVNDFVNFINFLPLSWGNLRPSFADTFVDRANGRPKPLSSTNISSKRLIDNAVPPLPLRPWQQTLKFKLKLNDIDNLNVFINHSVNVSRLENELANDINVFVNDFTFFTGGGGAS